MKSAGHILFAPMRLLRVSKGFPNELIIRDEFLIDKLLPKIEKNKPVTHWEHVNPFLGKISKTKYENN